MVNAIITSQELKLAVVQPLIRRDRKGKGTSVTFARFHITQNVSVCKGTVYKFKLKGHSSKYPASTLQNCPGEGKQGTIKNLYRSEETNKEMRATYNVCDGLESGIKRKKKRHGWNTGEI